MGLNCRVFSPAAGSLCAWFDFGKADAIAFRADADALPIEDGQSNFGTGYGYQRMGDTLEVLIDGQWIVFRPITDSDV